MFRSPSHLTPRDHAPPADGLGPLLAWVRREWRAYVPVLLIFAFSRILFYATLLGSQHLLPTVFSHTDTGLGWLIDAHYRWDATIYREIAIIGYAPSVAAPNGSHLAFFPLMPLVMRFGGMLLGGGTNALAIGGVVVTQLAALIAACLLFALARADAGAAAYRAVAYCSLFPLAVFFNVPYTESLFFALSLWAFLAIRYNWWLNAGLAIALASACRVGGVLLVPVLLLALWQCWRRGELTHAALRRGVAAVALAPLGLLLFLVYLQWHTGDLLAFQHAQAFWPRSFVFPPLALLQGIGYVLNPTVAPDLFTYLLSTLNTLIVVGFLAVMVRCWRRWPAVYSLYALLTLALALVSPLIGAAAMQSTGRYAMVIFPVFIALGQFGQRRWLHLLWLGVSTLLFVILVALYTHWFFVV